MPRGQPGSGRQPRPREFFIRRNAVKSRVEIRQGLRWRHALGIFTNVPTHMDADGLVMGHGIVRRVQGRHFRVDP